MRKMMLCMLALLCATAALALAEGDEAVTPWTEDTRIEEVASWEGFGDWGRLIFPMNEWYYSGDTLGTLDLTWYNDIRPARTVEIVNWMREKTLAGEQVFYPIYTEEEIAADPGKADTGLFFFKADRRRDDHLADTRDGGDAARPLIDQPRARFAIVNAGGGMVFVGAMHDSFPHALELSKLGYNGFALIYRPGYDTAPADLARAIAYIHEHTDELEVDVTDYSLWGGSAGARMAAWLGSYRTSDFGEAENPRPAAVIMQYTGLSDIFGNEPATYNCVGTSDGIASYHTMEQRIARLKANGVDTMIEVFPGLPHGFGLGTGTVAEGWLNNAVDFWEKQMRE